MDGITWHWDDQAPDAPRQDGEGMVYMSRGVVSRGDEVWQYGVAFKSHHGDVEYRMQHTDGEIARFIQRRDGYVSADAEDGHLLTTPLQVSGSRLTVNADLGTAGNMRLSIKGTDGRPLAQAEPIRGNGTALPVIWEDRNCLEALVGQEVRIDCRIVDGKLFGVSLAE